MTKHQEKVASLAPKYPRRILLVHALALTLFCSGYVSLAVAVEGTGSCAGVSQAEADAVFNQAVSTVSALSTAAVGAKTRGVWKPNGSFRRVFFNQSGRALREIKSLLVGSGQLSPTCAANEGGPCVSKALPKNELLSAFDQIFEIQLPKGLRGLRRLQSAERSKFASAVEALPDNYIACG
jgi:hypothetical protein